MRRSLAGLLVVLFFLSACGPLPRPFGRSDDAAENALATNIFFEGVELLPLTGTTPPMGKLLAEAVIKRLEKDSADRRCDCVCVGCDKVRCGKAVVGGQDSDVRRLDCPWLALRLTSVAT